MDEGGFLIFLSHKAEVKKEVQALKDGLEEYGDGDSISNPIVADQCFYYARVLGPRSQQQVAEPVDSVRFRDGESIGNPIVADQCFYDAGVLGAGSLQQLSENVQRIPFRSGDSVGDPGIAHECSHNVRVLGPGSLQ